ncbi:T9SS type A sorting domain-containing protein [Reichenbachiella versicolor]|uniref:T9SS type A sorting domain-containing protein n=1 Tax=Reichenbachiella versicolor TaxID=1821036 RepID=UPI000D6E66AB|nr:T9SS type A sorting domain-containing protein [Reichenbachiella versicolor]
MKKRIVFTLMTMVIWSCINTKAQVPHSDPENKGNWVLNTDLSDEFESDRLDETKWLIQGRNGQYQSNWEGRQPSEFSTDNVRLECGKLKLQTRWQPEYEFTPDDCTRLNNGDEYCYGLDADGSTRPITTAAVISRRQFLHGYMEIKCKAADAPVTSSFWTTGRNTELDMFEMFGDHIQPNKENKGKERELKINMLDWSPGTGGKQTFFSEYLMDWNVADDFHTYGFDWTVDDIKMYADGKLFTTWVRGTGTNTERIKYISNENWTITNPFFLWVDSETFPWHGMPQEKDLPADYEIEYIRVWQKANTPYVYNDFFGFEGATWINNRSLSWRINGASIPYTDITNEKPYSGNRSLKFHHSEELPKNTQNDNKININVNSPSGSIQLDHGNHTLSMRIWKSTDSQLTKIRARLQKSNTNIDLDISSAPTGQWTEVSTSFSLSSQTPEDESLTLQIIGNLAGTTNTIYIDEVYFNGSSRGNAPNTSVATPFRYDSFKERKCQTTTAINVSRNANFEIYPNPAKGTVTITSDIIGHIAITSYTGKEISRLAKPVQSINIPIENLKSGIYFIHLYAKTGTVSLQKLVVE